MLDFKALYLTNNKDRSFFKVLQDKRELTYYLSDKNISHDLLRVNGLYDSGLIIKVPEFNNIVGRSFTNSIELVDFLENSGISVLKSYALGT